MKQNSTIQVVASGRGGFSTFGKNNNPATRAMPFIEKEMTELSPHVRVGKGWMPVSKGRNVRQVAHDILREGIMKLPIIVVDKAPWRGKLTSKIVVC